MQIKNKLNKLMKVYIYIFSFVLFIIFFSTTYLHANIFKVSNIKVSSSFELDFNKNRVIDSGFRIAFSNLISMITTTGDQDKLKKIPLKKLKGMINSFTISDEKFINYEYFAKLEVTFNKKDILTFLEKNNIFPSIPTKKTILLIPILVDMEVDKIYLFTDNIFYQKWNALTSDFHLLNYLLPSEDIEDLSNIQKNLNTIEDYDFINLIKKYDLSDYIISIIFKNKNEIKVLSKINLKDTFKVDNQIFTKIDLNDEKDLQIVLNKLKTVYENYWKKNNQINTSIKLPLTVSVNSNEYSKIKNFESTLNSLDLVSDFYILKFNNKNTFFRIIYNGSPKNFLNDMMNQKFDLEIINNIWVIK